MAAVEPAAVVKKLLPICAVAAGALALQAAWNLRTIRRPQTPTTDVHEDVTVLVPARNESHRITDTIASLRAQKLVPQLRVRILDDDSDDDTWGVAAAAIDGDDRFTLERGTGDPLPPGWLGKNYACHRLADGAPGSVLVFVDADVHLEPTAISALVRELRTGCFDLVAPYPRQIAVGRLERLVQPLLVWSWMSTIPLAVAESRQWASMSAANGQLLVFDAAFYRRLGGHERVHGDVIEDVALMRAVRTDGGRATTVDGSHLASCRMYDDSRALLEGYTKSAWKAFGGIPGSIAVNATLTALYVLPALAMVFGRGHTRTWGVLGYAAGVTGRALVANATGGRAFPDSLAHPASIVAFVVINKVSWWKHLTGTTTWKGRTLS